MSNTKSLEFPDILQFPDIYPGHLSDKSKSCRIQ